MRPLMRSATMAASLLLASLLLLLVPLVTAWPAGASQNVDDVRRLHRLDHLDERSAVELVLDYCATRSGEICDIRESSPSGLLVVAQPQAQVQIRRLLGELDVVRTRAFQVVVVRASTSTSPAASETASFDFGANVPQNIRSTLRGLTEVLPVQQFELVDAGLLNTSREGTIILAGSQGETYRASLNFQIDGSQLQVENFQVRAYFPPVLGRAEGVGSTSAHAGQASKGGNQLAADRGAVDERSQPARPSSQRVVATRMALDLGQTVVAGTARLGSGDEMLVVLLTALPESPTT